MSKRPLGRIPGTASISGHYRIDLRSPDARPGEAASALRLGGTCTECDGAQRVGRGRVLRVLHRLGPRPPALGVLGGFLSRLTPRRKRTHQAEGRSPDIDHTTAAQRVVVVAHYFLPHVGGIEQVVSRQCQSLARLGHSVTVVTCAHERRAASLTAPQGFSVRRIPALNFLETRFGVPFPIPAPAMVRRLWRELGRADSVHLHDVFYLPSQLAFLLACMRDTPVHMTQHVALVDHPSRVVRAAQRAVYRTVGGLMLRQAQTVVTYNVLVHDFILGLGVKPERVTLMHNGIDVSYFTPASPAEKAVLRARWGLPVDKPIVLFVGRLVPKKGHELVASAASHTHTTLIVGEGEATMDVRRPGIVHFGPASQSVLRELYRLSDLFVFPALGEIFTLVMQEAMASGLPVVTTDDPAYLRYDLDRSMIRFCARDSEAVAEAIQDLLTDSHLRAAMGAYSRRLAESRFSWEANFGIEYKRTHGSIPPRRSVHRPMAGVRR